MIFFYVNRRTGASAEVDLVGLEKALQTMKAARIDETIKAAKYTRIGQMLYSAEIVIFRLSPLDFHTGQIENGT